MMRLARLPLVATLVLVVACHGDRALTPGAAGPSFALSDGTRAGGNPDFFFQPPIVSNPSRDANFDATDFNPDLLPVVNVCQLSGNPSLGPVSCAAVVFGPVTAPVSIGDQQYKVNWDTDEAHGGAGLNVNAFYRIQVFASTGGTLLGFADVDPVSTGKELKNVQTGDVFGLVDGRTLPIKFRIEEGALCQPRGTDTCSSETIVLRDGGSVVLEETGDRVDIPAQNSDRTITVTLQLCNRQDGIDVDLRKFGNCLTVTSDPPLGGFRFSPAATVSMCSVFIDPAVAAELAALGAQRKLVTMHRQDDGDIFALPHGGQFCDEPSEPIGSGSSNLFQQLARSLGGLFAPRPLHAATVVLDVGPSGETDFFSDFQLALPAQMFPAEGTDEISGPAGGEAAPVPAVVMMDAGTPPQPVAGALVTFRITGGDGNFGTDEGEDPIIEVQVLSDDDGRAAVPRWVLGGGEGTNTVTASGRGFAGPDDDGPFMPDISLPTVCQNEDPCQAIVQLPDPLDDREVVFTATLVSEIRVSGFTSDRTPFPLMDPDGTPSASASALAGALQNGENFGPGGTVACGVDFRPFVTSIAAGSLVSGAGTRLIDVFFAGPTSVTLTSAEADELVAFVNAGGMLYLGGDTDENDGPAYNPFFNALDVSDEFTDNTLRSDQSSGQSSDPPNTTPLTNGPFGTVGPLDHTGYREFATSIMTALATGNNPDLPFTLLAEGAFRSGRVSATGDPIYLNFMFADVDNRAYFLNLFAFACR